MKINKYFFIITTALLFSFKSLYAVDAPVIGVVNFTTCLTESKYAKNEQEQFENIKKQWSSLIEDTEKELQDVTSKLEDQDYLDGLSPEALDELKQKQTALNENVMKYQNQLYQILNQANYFFIQKMSTTISKASEKIARDKKLDLVLNKEACFYNDPKMDVTTLVLKELDTNFEKEAAKKDGEKSDKKTADNLLNAKDLEKTETVK